MTSPRTTARRPKRLGKLGRISYADICENTGLVYIGGPNGIDHVQINELDHKDCARLGTYLLKAAAYLESTKRTGKRGK